MENSDPINPSPNLNQNQNGMSVVLPNSVGVLVLGIISIALCWCYGVIGLTCGIIALILGSKGKKLYLSNPGVYTVSSYNNLKAGWICAIIGTCLSAVYIIIVVIYVVVVGVALSTFPWQMMHQHSV